MSELSKQAQIQNDEAAAALKAVMVDHVAVTVGDPLPLPIVLAQIALSQATATLALVQATEAQTKAIEYQSQLMKGARR